MIKNKLSIFIFGNDTEKPLKLVVSKRTLLGIALSILFILILIFTFVIDYGGLLIDSLEKKRLQTENQELKRQLNLVDSKLEALEFNLVRAKTFITKLKLITNIDDPDRTLNLNQTNLPDMLTENKASESSVGSNYNQMPFNPFRERESLQSLSLETPSQRDYQSLAIRIDKAIQDTQLQEQSMTDLWQLLSERQSLLSATPSIKPSQGWISSLFGYRPNPFTGRTVLHAGIDIASNIGSPIIAPADGVVVLAGYDEGYGKIIEVDHGYGVTTRFAHCSQIFVKVGQKINRFDVIASVGNTGRSTGAHLHYEVRVGGMPRNPMLYILDE